MNRFLAFMLMGGLFGCSSAVEVAAEGSSFSEAGKAGEVVGGSDTGGKATGVNGGETGNGAAVNGGSNTGGTTNTGGGVACVPKTCDEVAKEKFNTSFPTPETAPAWNIQNNEPMPAGNVVNPASCGQVSDGCGAYINCGECGNASYCGADFIVNQGKLKSKEGISGICGGYVSYYFTDFICEIFPLFPRAILGSNNFSNSNCQLYRKDPDNGYNMYCCSGDFDIGSL